MTAHSSKTGGDPLPSPNTEQMLAAVIELGRRIHLEMGEAEIVDQFLDLLSDLFIGRVLAVRALDPRSAEPAHTYVRLGTLRDGVEHEYITLKQSSIEKTRLKVAIAESARVRVRVGWDSPFSGVAAGFAVPLVAAGELYGVLDVGYPLGTDLSEADEPRFLPIANHLSVALRNERLHRETTLLRDYQAKLIEHANALILGVDRSWRITVCNHALCALTGFQRNELIGLDLRDWLAPDERTRLRKLFYELLEYDLSDSINVELPTKDGGQVRTVWSVATIRGHGEVQAMVAIGQDQTKLLELQNQVIQAEKLATLGQLAAGVVHELNNPLTSITVYAEYLLKRAETTGADPGDVDKLRRISAGAQRIMAFAKDLVQYAKPAGDETAAVSLNSVVAQSLSFCEHLFDRSGVSLTREFDDDLPPIDAVAGQLEQIVINLVTNAVQACGGEGQVRVRTFRPSESEVALAISDSGPGIAPADTERVFEPFFTTKSDGEGTGLGLSIVRNIIEQHGGQIRVVPAREGGAEFECLLPIGR